jgi:hypothetical protein
MGLLDKAKGAAMGAMAQAQQAAQQGQAKVGAYQQGRSEADLYKSLGEAFYREQRHGGDQESVGNALGALDAHFAAAAQAAAQAPAQQWQGGAAPAAGQPYTPPPSSGAAPTGGNFTLDDV